MKKFSSIFVLSLGWFLVSPFPFKNGGWHFFGGFRLIRPYLPYSDSFSHEVIISNAYYSSHAYPLFSLAFSVLMGVLSYSFIHKIHTK